MLRGTAAGLPGGLGGAGVVRASGTAVPLTGSTGETVLATLNVPAGLLGSNGVLRLTTLWSATSTNANAKTGRIRMSGGTLVGSPAVTSNLQVTDMRFIYANNSTGAQKAHSGNNWYSTSLAAPAAPTVDTTTAWSMTLTGQLGSSTDTMSLEGYVLELIPAA